MARSLTCLVAKVLLPLTFLLPSAWAQQGIQLELGGQQLDGTALGYGNCQWLYPSDSSLEASLKVPALASDEAVFYAAEYGDGADRQISFILDESGGTGSGFDALYFDANNDNVIDPRTERHAYKPGRSSDHDIRVKLQITVGNEVHPYHVNFSAFPYQERGGKSAIHANLRNSSFYTGQADFAGKTLSFCILDLDSNGLYNDYQSGKLFRGDRLLVDINGDGSHRNSRSAPIESFPYGQFTKVGEHWYEITIAPSGARATVAPASPPLGEVRVPLGVRSALLVSATQAFEIDFVQKSGNVIAGVYELHELEVVTPNMHFHADFDNISQQIKIGAEQKMDLPFGPPLKIEPIVTLERGRLVVDMNVTGRGQERYDAELVRSGWGSPALAVVDTKGNILAAPEVGTVGKFALRGWSVPAHYNGLYRLVPVLDMHGVEHELITPLMRVVNGKVIE